MALLLVLPRTRPPRFRLISSRCHAACCESARDVVEVRADVGRLRSDAGWGVADPKDQGGLPACRMSPDGLPDVACDEIAGNEVAPL